MMIEIGWSAVIFSNYLWGKCRSMGGAIGSCMRMSDRYRVIVFAVSVGPTENVARRSRRFHPSWSRERTVSLFISKGSRGYPSGATGTCPTLAAPHGLRRRCRLESELGGGSLLSRAYSIRKPPFKSDWRFRPRDKRRCRTYVPNPSPSARWPKRGRSRSSTVAEPAANSRKSKLISALSILA
jgi:hypothetical protein